MQNDMQRLGEAAGLAAALAVESHCTPRGVSVEKLRAELIASGGLRAPGQKPRFIEKREQALGDAKALLPEKPAELAAELDGPRASGALLALSASARGSAGYDTLARAIGDAKPAVRFRAAAALSMHGDCRAIPALIQAVSERLAVVATPECHRVRSEMPAWVPAMLLLGRMRAREAVPAIAAALDDTATPFDALLAGVRSLGRIGDASAVAAMERLAVRPGVNTVRKLQVSSSVAKAVELDARWQLDLAIAEALAGMGVSRRDLVARYLDDPRAPIRNRAKAVSLHLDEAEAALR
jgi:HEAT repeat protein